MTFANVVAKHNGESYDLRTNYQSKALEVFQEPSKYLIKICFFIQIILSLMSANC